jgi:hypothetical protein
VDRSQHALDHARVRGTDGNDGAGRDHARCRPPIELRGDGERSPGAPLIVAGASKVVFIALVLSEGARYLSNQVGVAVAIDSVMVVLFGWYLVAARSAAPRAAAEPERLSV